MPGTVGMLEACVSEDTLLPTTMTSSTATSLSRARGVMESFANSGNTFLVDESSSNPGSKSGSLTKKGTLFPIIRSDVRSSHIPPPLSSSISAELPVTPFGWTSPRLLRLSPAAPSLSPLSLLLMVRGAGAPQVARAESLEVTGSMHPSLPSMPSMPSMPNLLGLPMTEQLDDNDSPTVVYSQASSRSVTCCQELESACGSKTLTDEDNAIFSGGIIEGPALLIPVRFLPPIRQRRMGYR